MVHPLQQQVRTIRRRARHVVLMHGFGWSLALVILIGLAIGVFDCLVRSQQPMVPYLLFAVFVGAVAIALRIYLLPCWFFRPSESETAFNLERHFPLLQDRLTSSLDFLSDSRQRRQHGSSELRQAVIEDTLSRFDSCDTGHAINAKSTRAALIGLLIACALLSIAMARYQSVSVFTAKRILVPWQASAWPQQNNLQFVALPSNLKLGSSLDFIVIDQKDRLPNDVFLQIRRDESSPVRQFLMRPVGDRTLFKIRNVRETFQVRAEGGDDQTDWHPIQIIEPPELVTVQFQIQPPAYSSLPVSESSSTIDALMDSKIGFSATVDRPVKSASLFFDSNSRKTRRQLKVFDGNRVLLDKDQMDPFFVQSSGHFFLQVTEPNGVKSQLDHQWFLKAQSDTPPNVTLTTDLVHNQLTTNAKFRVSIQATDDLKLQELNVDAKRDGQVIFMRELYQLAPVDEVDSGEANESVPRGELDSEPSGDAVARDLDIDLSLWSELDVGRTILLQSNASDLKPQVGQSESLSLAIVTQEQLLDHLLLVQSKAFDAVESALRYLERSQEQTLSFAKHLETVDVVSPSESARLQLIDLSQQRVEAALYSAPGGAMPRIENILTQLETNRLTSIGLYRKTSRLSGELFDLSQNEMSSIRELLRLTLVSHEEQVATLPGQSKTLFDQQKLITTRGSMNVVLQQQRSAIQKLRAIANQLNRLQRGRAFAQRLREIRTGQELISRETLLLQSKRLSRDPRLPAAMSLDRFFPTSRSQRELVKNFEQWISDVQETIQSGEADSTDSSSVLNDVIEIAFDQMVSEQMRRASAEIEQARLGQSLQAQKQVVDSIEQMLDRFSKQMKQDEFDFLSELEAIHDSIGELQTLSEQLRSQMEQMNQPDRILGPAEADSLIEQGLELSKITEGISKRSQEAGSIDTARELDLALSHLNESVAEQREKELDRALKQLEQAQRRLENARSEIEQTTQQVEREKAQAKLRHWLADLSQILRGQENVLVQVDGLSKLDSELAAPHLHQVAVTLEQQRNLITKSNLLVSDLSEMIVVQQSMIESIADMTHSLNGVEAMQFGDSTQAPMKRVIERVKRILSVLKEQQVNSAGDGNENASDPEQSGDSSGSNQFLHVQVKLLRDQQFSLWEETSQIDELHRGNDGIISAELEQRRNELARKQGELAEMLIRLIGDEHPNNPEPKGSTESPPLETLPDLPGF